MQRIIRLGVVLGQLVSSNVWADCGSTPDLARFYSNGWGVGHHNTRYQDDRATSIDAGNVANLELEWVFSFGDEDSPHSYPLATDDTLFIGNADGRVYALDIARGCERWTFTADEGIRTAIVHGTVALADGPRTLLYFGTGAGTAYAIRADDGRLQWKVDADAHPRTLVTGTPTFYDGRLYVPVSSYEVVVAAAPFYGCCTFRGSILALDATTGAERWRRYTIDEPARVTGRRLVAGDSKGPSGAPVWSAPTLDPEHGRIYFGTGENYSDPATRTSDAIIALELDDGAVAWVRQLTENDAWNAACALPVVNSNCPDANGPDFDFGAPPILTRTVEGRRVLIAGQKSGMAFAIDPADGQVLWQRRVGRGGKLGGIHWGMAVNEALGLVYIPVSDRATGSSEDKPEPGLQALDIATGEVRWTAPSVATCDDRDGCFPGFSAAIVASRDLVFAGALDGRISAFHAATGESLWSFDTWREFTPVNGGKAHGAAIDVHGPALAGDRLFLTSGYKGFGQGGGNAFLSFRLRKADAQ